MTKYTEEEVQEHRRLWLEDLRSGKNKQTKNRLATVEEDGTVGYCCLGRACEVAIANGLDIPAETVVQYEGTEDERTVIVYGKEREYLTLPLAVAEWYGLGAEVSPELDVEYEVEDGTGVARALPDGLPERNLTSLNDSLENSYTFEQIADAVEKHGLKSSQPVALPF